MKAVCLKTAGLLNPVGIDIRKPEFSWHCSGGIRQTAFRVVASDTDGCVIFDSGRVESGQMHCRYSGDPLTSREKVLWKVCLWDEKGLTEWSDEASFEMSLLEKEDWAAKWICGQGTDTEEHLPADCYRKRFGIEKSVRQARLYATALGVYTAAVNGTLVSDVLAPGTTNYKKRVHYQTYDVTDTLRQGENDLFFCVADGWFKGTNGAERESCVYGTQLKLLAQLEIVYTDGTQDVIATDSSFGWSNDGPVRSADLYDGIFYDARLEPSCSQNAVCDETEDRNLCASNSPAIREHECLKPQLTISPSGKHILDFGQNMAGYVRFRTCAPAGTKICLRLFEATDGGEYSDTTLSFPNGGVRTVAQMITCVCPGGEFVFQPAFFYSGFRYALVEGPEEVDPADFEAAAVYSDLDYTGEFTCSNEMVNQFVSNTRWSMKSNFIDIPTDCPQREKAGWTGDAQLFCRTAGYFADTSAFFRKWLKDMEDCQREDGCIVNVCPVQTHPGNRTEALNGSCGWGDAAVIIPYTIWKETGDLSVVRDSLNMMLRWKDYMKKICSDKSFFEPMPEGHPLAAMQPLLMQFKLKESPYNVYIPESGAHWGEWCVPQSQEPSDENPMISLIKPKQEVTCAYTHYSMRMLKEMLGALGMHKEADECREYEEGSRMAYHVHWVEDGHINTGHMAELVRPIALGLLTKEEAKDTAAKLNEMVVSRNYKVGTGFLSTPFLLQILARYDYTESAYNMLENTEAPGWLAMVKQGATTVWEEYECYDENGSPKPHSMNHYSAGAMCSFLFDTVCGIQVAGENKVEIAPLPGGSLTYASAERMTAYGLVKSAWRREGDRIKYSFEIPANVSADIKLPDERRFTLDAGNYEF